MRINPMTMLVAAGVASLLPTPARALECPTSNQPVSCHRLTPNDAISSVGDASYPTQNYVPYIWNGAGIEVPAPAPNGAYVTEPGLRLHSGAGGWGERAAEPMAIAHTSFEYLTETGVQWLPKTTASYWYPFPCAEGTALCYYDAGQDSSYIWTPATATIKRRYRATKTNPAPLPGGVDSLPILVDYRMGISITGLAESGNSLIDGLSGNTAVRFGHFAPLSEGVYNFKVAGVQCTRANGLVCSQISGGSLPTTGHTVAGTFSRAVPLASIDLMALQVEASLTIPRPNCRDQDTPDGIQCLVTPWGASGHAVADPYVYIDPSWEYADWFELEMAADETDTDWVIPERTDFDIETLTLAGEGNGGEGGTANGTGGKPGSGGKSGAGGHGTADDGATAGSDGVGAGGTGDGDDADDGAADDGVGCGCSIVGGSRALGLSWLALALGGAALSRRRRAA